MDFTTNYCGMYYSDGRIQPSVANGKTVPNGPLDSACRDHDTAYALALNDQDLEAADNKFQTQTHNLGFRGKLYGNLVKHGNSLARNKMAFLLPLGGLIGYSAGAMAVLSTMFGGKKPALRTPVDTGVVYNPGEEPNDSGPSGTAFEPAIPTGDSDIANSSNLGYSSWSSGLKDPGLMQPLSWMQGKADRSKQQTYKPLKKKTIKKTEKLIKIHDKYNPPKNKNNKKKFRNPTKRVVSISENGKSN
jgi:hypothetical protein